MDVAYRFPLHKYQNEIKNIDFRVEGYFRINIETDENVETKHFTISDDYGKSLNDLLTTIQGFNAYINGVHDDRSMYEIGRPYDGNKFFVTQNFMGYGVMYRDLLGQCGEDNLVGVQIGYNSLYTISTNKDVCKAARSKYPFPREYNQSRIQEDKRTVPGCEALKWNRAYAIDALGLLTMNRYPVEYGWVGYGGGDQSKGQGGNKAGVDMEVAVKVEIRVEVAMCLQVNNAESKAFLAVPVVVPITDKVVAALMAWAAVLRLWLVFIHTKATASGMGFSHWCKGTFLELQRNRYVIFKIEHQKIQVLPEFAYVLSYYYGKFLRSSQHKLWSASLTQDSRILSLEHVKENRTLYKENEYGDELAFTYNEQSYSGFEEFQYGSDNSVSLQYPEIGRSSRIDDEVVQDERQRDDNDLQDERQDQPKEEEVEPRRCKRERTKKSFRPDFVSFMVKNKPTSYRKAVTSLEWLNGMKPLKVK
ncbi:hypothetical protein Tco_0789040 [Tanacetum coccineum]